MHRGQLFDSVFGATGIGRDRQFVVGPGRGGRFCTYRECTFLFITLNRLHRYQVPDSDALSAPYGRSDLKSAPK